jgi:esterase/lipase
VGEMIRGGSDYKEVEAFINQNAQKYSFMNRTALFANVTIGKEEFEGLYWSGRKENFYPYWEKINIPTLVLLGEDDVILNAIRNKTLIEAFNNKKIEIKMFSRANHIMKKSFNPVKYPDFDWPRVIDGYLDFVGNWVEKKIVK